MSNQRVASWMPLVRAAIPRCVQPFTASDVCRAAGYDPHESSRRQAVQDCLDRLFGRGELDKETKKRGETRSTSTYTRTATFRGEEYDFGAQKRAAAFLQDLSITWGNRRAAAD